MGKVEQTWGIGDEVGMMNRSNLATRFSGAKLSFCWLLALGAVFAQADSYKIKEGDTLNGIAHKFHISRRELLDANDLKATATLRVGHKLHIPSHDSSDDTPKHSSRHSTKRHSRSSGGSRIYIVKNGEIAWTIAQHLHVTRRELQESNPNINIEKIGTGTKLIVPSSSSESHSSRSVASSEDSAPARGTYRVQRGDSDWTIASKLGVTLKSLHRNNPHVNWDTLRAGARLKVPKAVASLKTRRIRTRLAAINSENVTIRRGPSTSSEKVTTVRLGTVARVLDHEGSWYKLRFPKGTEAWVRSDLLNPVKHHQTAYASTGRRRRHHGSSKEPVVAMSEIKSSKLLTTAFSYRGTPYRTGGTSRSGGFDCSGLTSTVYRKNGIAIPRTAREQSGVGKRVDIDHLQKGDLVFFHTNRSRGVNHVGMYIGNGKFIHASSGGGRVQVSSLTDGYYRRRFSGARRIVKATSHSKKKKHSSS